MSIPNVMANNTVDHFYWDIVYCYFSTYTAL